MVLADLLCGYVGFYYLLFQEQPSSFIIFNIAFILWLTLFYASNWYFTNRYYLVSMDMQDFSTNTESKRKSGTLNVLLFFLSIVIFLTLTIVFLIEDESAISFL